MPHLLRPHIPLEVRCRVVLRQLGEMWPDDVIAEAKAERGLGHLLAFSLKCISEIICCEVQDLRLDHNPALGARPKVFKRGKHVDYIPPANDPLHLEYRPHGKTFERSHLIKTNVRGDHGQHPDRVLIKKQRKLEKKKGATRRTSSGFRKRPSYRKRIPLLARPKGRPLRSANRWPAKGSQKFSNRSKHR